MNRPHLLKLSDIQDFFAYVYERQSRHGPSQAFRFMKVQKSFKDSTLQPSRYPDERADGTGGNSGNPSRPKPKKKKQKQPPTDAASRPIEQLVRFDNAGPSPPPGDRAGQFDAEIPVESGTGPTTTEQEDTTMMDVDADQHRGRPNTHGMPPEADSQDYIDVSFDEMTRIQSTTNYVAIACNGPNDGPVPRYRIPRHIYDHAADIETAARNAEDRPSVRGPLPTPQMTPDVDVQMGLPIGVSTRQRSRAVAGANTKAVAGPSRAVAAPRRGVPKQSAKSAEPPKKVRKTADQLARQEARVMTTEPARALRSKK